MNLTVNGREHEITSPPLTPLLHVLREELEITSPKAGCQQGGCGTCTVLVDGEARRSCLTAVVTVVLTAGYWRTRLGGDPSVIGRRLRLDGGNGFGRRRFSLRGDLRFARLRKTRLDARDRPAAHRHQDGRGPRDSRLHRAGVGTG